MDNEGIIEVDRQVDYLIENDSLVEIDIDILTLRLTLADVIYEEVRLLEGEVLTEWLNDIEAKIEEDNTNIVTEGLSLLKVAPIEEFLSDSDSDNHEYGVYELPTIVGLVMADSLSKEEEVIMEEARDTNEVNTTSSSV